MTTAKLLLISLFFAMAPAVSATLTLDTGANFPDRPLRLVVPNAPGSGVDTLGRVVSNALTSIIGQPIVVDNRPGAGGTIGTSIGKNASPDGYTLIVGSTSTLVIAPLLQKKLPYDPVKDFDHIMQIAVTPNILVVNPALPVKSVKELIEYAKSKGGRVNMASAGPGSQAHLAGVVLMIKGNFQSTHVPYRGGGASQGSVVSGESQWTFMPAPAVIPQVKAGRLRALAHSLAQRSPLLGDLPTIAESLPGFEYSGWQGFLLPKGTPRPIVDKLYSAMTRTMNRSDVKKAFATQATEVVGGTAEEFRTLVQESVSEISKVINASRLKVE